MMITQALLKTLSSLLILSTVLPTGLKSQSTNSQGYSEFARWSPDGSKIAFQSNRDGNFEIYVIDSDGTNLTRLTNNLSSDQFPSWSPDGNQIAFSSTATGGSPWVPGLSALFIVDADGKNRRRISNFRAGNDRPSPKYHDMYPAWSPDGKKIAFLSDEGNGFREVYTISPDGSERTQITFHNSHHWNLVWTPDSKRIIFDFREDGFPFGNNSPMNGIYSMSMEGAWYSWGDDLQPLVNEIDSEAEYDCVISPDGTTIGFHIGYRDPDKHTGLAGMYFAKLEYIEGRLNINKVTVHQRSKADEYSPSWSPDGKKIAFTSTRDGHPEIYIMDADGQNVERLTFSR